ncbi:MAG: FkbM family methyltransferase [Pseudomonadota bacterium]
MSAAEFIYTVLLKPKWLRAIANSILKAITPEVKNIKGAKVYLNPEDPVVSGALTLNLFEKDELDFFSHFFRPHMTFLDVGANVGLYSAMALSSDDFEGKVVAIEPHLESQKYLQKTLAENARIAGIPEAHVINCAVAASDKPGELTLYSNSENKGDNRLYSDDLLDQKETVKTSTIDLICNERDIRTVDFIKIDIQGAEVNAITGGFEVIGNSSDCIILSELWPHGLERCGSSVDEYVDLLSRLGFRLFELHGKHSLSALNRDAIIQNCTGRKYVNVVGAKGKYVNALSDWED